MVHLLSQDATLQGINSTVTKSGPAGFSMQASKNQFVVLALQEDSKTEENLSTFARIPGVIRVARVVKSPAIRVPTPSPSPESMHLVTVILV